MKNKILKVISIFFLFVSTICFASPTNLKNQEVVTEKIYNTVILGGGVGALTSGIYLARAGYEPLIIEGKVPGGLITQSHMVENWPGEFKISGLDLSEKIKDQAEKNGCVFLSKEVIDVDFSQRPFVITLQDINDKKIQKIKANSCIVAMGTSSNYLNVDGEKKYWGKGISNCAVCDGSLYKNKDVAIIGGGDSAIAEANYLSNLAKNVYVIVRKDVLKGTDREKIKEFKDNVKVLFNSEVTSIKGNESVTGITVFDKKHNQSKRVDVDGVFLALGSKPNTNLFRNKLKMDENGYVLVDSSQKTSVDGVFALGDIVDPIFKQAITAAGDGAKAAISCQKNLESNFVNPSHFVALADKNVFEKASAMQADHSAAGQNGTVIEINNMKQFDEEISSSKVPIIVDFYATWCGPCKKIAAVIKNHSKVLDEKVKILKVNVDQNEGLSLKYKIKSMPTVIIFDNKKTVLSKKIGVGEISDVFANLENMKDQNAAEIETYLRNLK
ncbi:MAG: FAD-dependent oxidoreductase [Parachlamydiales bacterium]|jgi:thioredoxin-disulfide reductase/thioredoxin